MWGAPPRPEAVSGRGSSVYLPRSTREVTRHRCIVAPSFAGPGYMRRAQISFIAIWGRNPVPFLQHERRLA